MVPRFNIVRCKAKRKCKLCEGVTEKDHRIIEKIIWFPKQPYPSKENICFDCAKEYTDPVFVKFLEGLIRNIKSLQKEIDNEYKK